MKRIFMISSYPLFGEGVEALLRQLGGIEFIGREADIDSAMAHIKEVGPDVVIVDDGCPACDAHTIVMRVLREQPGTKVIGLNLQDNTLCIYREEQRIAHGVEDLKSAIVDEGNVQLTLDHEIGKEEN
jgi:DNA-binding NarL/FixJ family response regulator